MPPRGHGLFLRRWHVVPGMTSPAAAARAYGLAGWGWGAPVVAHYPGGQFTTKSLEPDYWRAFAVRSIPLWGCWALPRPGASVLDDARRLIERLATVGAAGLLLDPEIEYKHKQEEAAELASVCATECRASGLEYAVTSYSVTTGHPDFPWVEFAHGASWGLAQTYDRDNLFAPDYEARAVRSWEWAGYSPTFPCRGLNDHRTGRIKTLADLRRHLSLVRSPTVGVWGPASLPASHWRALAEWNAPRGGAGIGGLVALGALAVAVAFGGKLL